MLAVLKEIWKSLDANEKKYLKVGLWFIVILGLVSIFILPVLFTLPSYFGWMDFTNKGPVGDTINGISGPFIAILASILTFLAFYIQYKANIQQRDQFTESLDKQKQTSAEQEKVWRIERFENKFYELLRLHRANVDEMNIADRIRGRKCFVQMFYEFKYCYIIATDTVNTTPEDLKVEYEYGGINLIKFSYSLFFFGIGYNSEKQLMYSFTNSEIHLFRSCKGKLTDLQNKFGKLSHQNPENNIYLLNPPLSGIADERTFEISYFPFDGHANRLGHYYRHLFQTVTYVVDQDNDLFDDETKYSYIKTLRAQLSNHEQLMLYYNSLAWFDNEWREYFTKFRLIKNLPLPLADFGVQPMVHFKKEIDELAEKGISMFEWAE